jgi:hypothetical protein
MRAKIVSHITISAKLRVGVAVLSRPTTPTTAKPRRPCSDKPPMLRCRHDPRPDHGDYGDFSSGPRVGAARQDLGLLLGHAAMSDLPPNPLKSPILIVLLIAVVVAVLAAIGYIVTHW